MIERLKVRIPNIDVLVADELIQTAKDRIMLRVGLKDVPFPAELESIGVEIVTAMYNKHQMKHEGVSEERVDVFSMKFINNLLKDYDAEFEDYKRLYIEQEDVEPKRGRVMFI